MKNSLLRMVFPVAVLLLTAGCGRPHFISDESIRREVDSVLNARAETFGPAWESLYAPEGKLTAEEKEALDFLYAYMPTADITDYPTALHLENVRAAFRARKEMGWNGGSNFILVMEMLVNGVKVVLLFLQINDNKSIF